MTHATSFIRAITAGALLVASALHVAWARGSTCPYSSTSGLTDNVVGSSRAPSPGACYAVATGLGAAAAMVAAPARRPRHRLALGALAFVFAVRAAFGFAGRTDLLVPGSASATFRRNDRRLLSPLCTALALGIVSAALADRAEC
ncbi:MAG: DUF3995 domain-containing protein [Ilumatobacteraceae bacterium]